MSRPIPEILDRMGQDAERILNDTDLCPCPSCVAWSDRAEGTHAIPTDGYEDMVHPILTRTAWGTYAIRADVREAMYLVGNAYQMVPTEGDITPL